MFDSVSCPPPLLCVALRFTRFVGEADTANSNGHHANYESDRETAEILVKAGLKKMPKTAIEWEKFERVKKGAASCIFPSHELLSARISY